MARSTGRTPSSGLLPSSWQAAVAGWTQGDMGGRALLRRKQQVWEIILCAGDGIRSRDALAKAGIPNQDAATLERELAEAESKLEPQHVAMFSRFEGMLMMDGSGAHPPATIHRTQITDLAGRTGSPLRATARGHE